MNDKLKWLCDNFNRKRVTKKKAPGSKSNNHGVRLKKTLADLYPNQKASQQQVLAISNKRMNFSSHTHKINSRNTAECESESTLKEISLQRAKAEQARLKTIDVNRSKSGVGSHNDTATFKEIK